MRSDTLSQASARVRQERREADKARGLERQLLQLVARVRKLEEGQCCQHCPQHPSNLQ